MQKDRNKKYMMHKYWGKKPSKELRDIIEKYSGENDTVLDPFAGYGGFSCEAVLLNRNVISNDLNPVSNFINQCLLENNINLNKLNLMLNRINKEIELYEKKWYKYDVGIITTALRDTDDKILKLRIKVDGKIKELEDIDDKYLEKFEEFEKNSRIIDWFPINKLIINSRISAKMGMQISDLFPKRSLACHAKLLSIIENFENSPEKNMLLLAFTSNIANCSKLVPPIKSRGEMSQGAWMTGFYIGETYLENNVFHYFMNRIKKIISGKKEYLEDLNTLSVRGKYLVTNEDAKNLSLKDDSIDLVFTDFPYGDAVPYFEQSIIWNSWLKYEVDYENEIVISDSKERGKDSIAFKDDITIAIKEIYRVLKNDKYFVFTFHSLSGFEWLVLNNALIKTGFIIEDCNLLLQKTLPPRQLTRKNTIKGDLVVVCKKSHKSQNFIELEEDIELIKNLFKKTLKNGAYFTNDVIINFLKLFFEERIVVQSANIFSALEDVAEFDGEGWKLT